MALGPAPDRRPPDRRGIPLIAIPGALALALAGNTLTAAAGLATAVILTASAITSFRALAGGALGGV